MNLRDDFRDVTGFYSHPLEGCEINSQGILRSKKTQRIILPFLLCNKAGEVTRIVYHTKLQNGSIYINLEKLYFKTFGKNIWEVFNKDEYIKFVENLIGGKTRRSRRRSEYKKSISFRVTKKYRRKCHDCGRPTNNYRCNSCWEKIREKHGVSEADLEAYGIWRV